MIRLLFLSLVLLAAAAVSPAHAQGGYDPGAPCGRDENGTPYPCTRPNPSANLEAACLTTGRVENCVPYHQNACQIRGFQQACRLYQMGANCFGGDPNMCNHYVTLLRANTACALSQDPNACAYLRQQGF